MTQQEKLAMLEEIMELDAGTLKTDTVLCGLDEWNSLSVLSFIAMMDEEFHKNVTGKSVRECKTVVDLLAMMEK